jgi:hypothetical protein
MYKKMNFVSLEEEELNGLLDEPPLLRLLKNLSQKLKLTYEVVKKNPTFAQLALNEQPLFDHNHECYTYHDPNLFKDQIIFNEFGDEDIKKSAN